MLDVLSNLEYARKRAHNGSLVQSKIENSVTPENCTVYHHLLNLVNSYPYDKNLQSPTILLF